jgi:hypothetical protein
VESGRGMRNGRVVTWGERETYRLYISLTISISASACAIFCSEDNCGLPPRPKKDIFAYYVDRIFNRRLGLLCRLGGVLNWGGMWL